MSRDVVLQNVDERGAATVTQNRLEVGNGDNPEMVDGLIGALRRLAGDATVRCLVIRGAGKHFQARAMLGAIFPSGPGAIAMTKRSFLGTNGLLLDEPRMTMLADEGWTRRALVKGHEGTTALREKRHSASDRARKP
jgi:methylglutaconyl-CoA hydratase